MILSLRKIVLTLAAAGGVSAQPVVFPNGVVNVASYARPGLPGGAIARGSTFALFGAGIGPSAGVQASAFPLQAALGGVSIRITQGTVSVDALPTFVASTQVNAIMPSNAPLGVVSLQLTFNGQRSNPSPVRVVNSSFGSFSANSAGFGPGIVQNFVSPAEQPINSLAVSATPGQVVTLWGTGLGPGLNPDNVAPAAGSLPTPIEIWVGSVPIAAADILYSGRTPCCSGIDQIVFRIPANAPPGCYVPVFVRTDRTVVGNSTTIAIRAPGSDSCADPANPFTAAYRAGGKLGAVLLSRIQFLAQVDLDTALSFSGDFGKASFSEENGSQFFFNSYYSYPPPGSCTVYTRGGNVFTEGQPGGPATVRPLDAGAGLTLTGPGGSVPLLKTGFPDYGGLLGAQVTGSTFPPLFLAPGNFSVNGPGGADVGSMQIPITVSPALNFASLAGLVSIPRDRDLPLAWEAPPASDSLVVVMGGNYDLPTDSSAAFFCSASPSDRGMTIPSWVLSALPASRAKRYQSQGLLFMGSYSFGSASTTVSGVRAVQPVSIGVRGQSVLFR
jgi:uncharacterized protein (TIGR03437 family)